MWESLEKRIEARYKNDLLRPRPKQSRSRTSSGEYQSFMSSRVIDMHQQPMSRKSEDEVDIEDDNKDIWKLLKDAEYFGSLNMPWKERKKLENQNIVALGGKPTKKHRTPLSVAKVAMKNQKKREVKKLEEGLILGRFTKHGNRNNEEKSRKPEDRVLRASEGHFSRGVLDVKHLLRPGSSSINDSAPPKMVGGGEGKGKGKGKSNGKGRGKGKGKGNGKQGKRRGR